MGGGKKLEVGHPHEEDSMPYELLPDQYQYPFHIISLNDDLIINYSRKTTPQNHC